MGVLSLAVFSSSYSVWLDPSFDPVTCTHSIVRPGKTKRLIAGPLLGSGGDNFDNCKRMNQWEWCPEEVVHPFFSEWAHSGELWCRLLAP